MEPEEQRRHYEAGATIVEIQQMTGQSYSTTRRRLAAAGTPMRHEKTERHLSRIAAAQRAPIDEEALRLLSTQGLSSREMSERLGWSEETVRKAQIRLGLGRLPAKARPRRNAFWAGGVQVDKHGYILVHWPDHPQAAASGYVRQHRILMERLLGRSLLRHEVVDHRNGDTSDNRDENLRLFPSNAEHLRATRTGRRKVGARERAVLTRWAVQRATRRAEAIRQVSESGADPSLWRYFRPQE